MRKEERVSEDYEFTNNLNILLTLWKDNNVFTIAIYFDVSEMLLRRRFVKERVRKYFLTKSISSI